MFGDYADVEGNMFIADVLLEISYIYIYIPKNWKELFDVGENEHAKQKFHISQLKV